MGVKLIRIRVEDNVGVAVEAIAKGERVRTAAGDDIVAQDDIKYGFKVALRAIARGERWSLVSAPRRSVLASLPSALPKAASR